MSESGRPDTPLAEDAILLLLTKVERGEGTVADRQQLAQWIGNDPTRRAELEAMRTLLGHAQGLTWEGGDPSQTLQRIHDRLAHDPLLPQGPTPGVGAVRNRSGLSSMISRRWWLGAAAALGIAGMAFIVAHRWPLAVSPLKIREYASHVGTRQMITLDDGTRVVLGPESRVLVAGDFGHTERSVVLEGQALFTVVHDQQHPFVVRTSRAEIRDIGTVFAVSDFADDPNASIAVSEGEVAVKGTALQAYDVVVTDGSGHFQVQRNADVSPYIDWAQGRLVFQDTPLHEMVRELDRVFDLKIVIADSALAARHVSATFDNESADQVLDAVTDVLGARYERDGRAVVIRPGTDRARQVIPSTRIPLTTAQAGSVHE